jgi:hypothetical protein
MEVRAVLLHLWLYSLSLDRFVNPFRMHLRLDASAEIANSTHLFAIWELHTRNSSHFTP